jgi:hypothetical protein
MATVYVVILTLHQFYILFEVWAARLLELQLCRHIFAIEHSKGVVHSRRGHADPSLCRRTSNMGQDYTPVNCGIQKSV